MEFENVILSTESITLFTATGLHTFENLIDLNTLNLEEYKEDVVKSFWKNYLDIVCGLDNNAIESFINEHGYVIPQDWFNSYCAFIK